MTMRYTGLGFLAAILLASLTACGGGGSSASSGGGGVTTSGVDTPAQVSVVNSN